MAYKVGLNMDEYNEYDISEEKFREYLFPTGTVTIYSPEKVYIKKGPLAGVVGGGSHRIILQSGRVQYIPQGWLSLIWENKDLTTGVMNF